MLGVFYGVGIGPGDPDLITRKGYRLLQSVPCVAVPKSASDTDSLAYEAILDILQPTVDVVELVMPMSSDAAVLNKAWTEAARTVYDRLVRSQDVAMAVIGDPLFYATFGHLANQLRVIDPAVQMQIIPGITSMAACAASAGESLVSGSQLLKVIPCTLPIETIAEELETADCAFLMKITAQLARIVELLKHYPDRRVFMVSRAGTTLTTISEGLASMPRDAHYMSSIIVKKSGDNIGD